MRASSRFARTALVIGMLSACATDPEPGEWWAMAPCQRVEEVSSFIQQRAADDPIHSNYQGADCKLPDGATTLQVEIVVDVASVNDADKLYQTVLPANAAASPSSVFELIGSFCDDQLELRSRTQNEALDAAILRDFQRAAITGC